MGADLYLQSERDRLKAELGYDRVYAELRELDTPDNRYDHDATLQAKHRQFVEIMAKVDEGNYYRDSYNDTSLANLIGLSYWKDTPGIGWKGKGEIPAEVLLAGQERWLAKLREAEALLPGLVKVLRLDGVYKSESYDATLDYFETKRRRFVALLEKSKALGEPLMWSV